MTSHFQSRAGIFTVLGDSDSGGGGGRNYAGFSESDGSWAAAILHVPLVIGDVALLTWMRSTDFVGSVPDTDNLIRPTQGPIEVFWVSGSTLVNSWWREMQTGDTWVGMGYFRVYEDSCHPDQTSGDYQFQLRASGWLHVDVDPGEVYPSWDT
jgi:hypothetical protein